jgi:hypothetical protein
VAFTVTGLLLVSCGDDDDTTSAATTGTSATTTAPSAASTTAAAGTTVAGGSDQLCADREALLDSVDALKEMDFAAEGVDGVKAAVTDVKDNLAALRESAGDELRPQVDAVQGDLDDLEAAIEQLGSGGAAAAVSALTSLAGSAKTLLDDLEAGACATTTT